MRGKTKEKTGSGRNEKQKLSQRERHKCANLAGDKHSGLFKCPTWKEKRGEKNKIHRWAQELNPDMFYWGMLKRLQTTLIGPFGAQKEQDGRRLFCVIRHQWILCLASCLPEDTFCRAWHGSTVPIRLVTVRPEPSSWGQCRGPRHLPEGYVSMRAYIGSPIIDSNGLL